MIEWMKWYNEEFYQIKEVIKNKEYIEFSINDKTYKFLLPIDWIKSKDPMRTGQMHYIPVYDIYDIGIVYDEDRKEKLCTVDIRTKFYKKIKKLNYNKLNKLSLANNFATIIDKKNNVIDCDLLFQPCDKKCVVFDDCLCCVTKKLIDLN